MNDDTRELIGASIRTTLVGIPMPPGCPNFPAMIAQGWSEYENHLFKTRIEEFFTEVRVRLESLEALDTARLKRILSLETQTALLEEAVSATAREATGEKRRVFASFYVAAITGEIGDDSDQINSLLNQLTYLTPSDLEVLSRFADEGFTTGDRLTDSNRPALINHPIAKLSAAEQEKHLASLKLSLVKLETHGLVEKGLRVDGGGFIDDGSHTPFNEFRKNFWKLTYIGRQLLTAISTDH